MSTRMIRLRSVKDATIFVRAAEKCGFDVDLCRGKIVVDAKSLMGVLGMDLTKDLTVVYHHDADAGFDRALARFAVQPA